MLLASSAYIFHIFLSGTLSECQTVSIQVRSNIQSVETVCKDYLSADISPLARKELIHISLASFLWDADPDQTPQNAASVQGLYCLLTESSIKFE